MMNGYDRGGGAVYGSAFIVVDEWTIDNLFPYGGEVI